MFIRQKLKHLYTRKKLWILFSLLCVKFSFGFIEALDSKGIIIGLKKRYYVNHGMRWRRSFHFRDVTNKIVFTLQVYFARSDSLFSFPNIFRIFRQEK